MTMSFRVIAAVSAATLLLAACTSVEPGTPSATETTPGSDRPPASTSQTAAESGAPDVENPVDVSAFQADPCLGMTSEQLTELGLQAGRATDDEVVGKSCLWRNENAASVDLAFLAKPGGLDFIYRNKEADYYKYFVELPPIDGLPAVAASTTDSRQTAGECHVYIGTSKDTAISLATAPSYTKIGNVEACELTTRVAKMVLQTVKTGG
ncbi:DUF3558 domain-containing protein [Actinokineospora pegani]|uniref:DUF3558 domain-containing protein n=1 Tax=Actinokineospora pegani TaxID=2654637 RepID=UPI0012EADE47|nr:DUF3558 domain-containing protein [Actinokineospora pegani]